MVKRTTTLENRENRINTETFTAKETKRSEGRMRKGENVMDKVIPLGIQGFEGLRNDGYKYVDKTEYIYNLVHSGKPYFLSRPRRFGKSLLLSAMKAYWEGKKELFSDLKIEKLEEENSDAWKPHPIFYFDFDGDSYLETPIEKVLDSMLCDWEMIYGDQFKQRTLGDRFQKLLEAAKEKTGKRCVVLIDEYDKPLLDTIEQPEIQKHIKDVFKGFFSRLKKADESIQFVFITGVTKFHKVSIFSDLNQLRDISLSEDFAAICGITDKEIDTYFSEEIEAFAKKRNITVQDCRIALRKQYDGYHFNPAGEAVYNPYSLLSAFLEKDLGCYWFETGTPTFLISKLREIHFDLRRFTNQTIFASESILKDYTGDSLDPVPLLYQSGYLTISEYDPMKKRYTLSFPNEEVRYGFLESLMPSYAPMATPGNGLDIFTLDIAIENGHLEDIRNILTGLFAGIPYTRESDPFEHYFQTVIYLVFTLLGKFVQCEMHTFTGRIDCRVQTKKYIYLFEFKRDATAKAGLEQIDSKEYALAFVADSRKLYKIGVSFDSATRKLSDWAVAE